jgi:Xaa-Pro aminopeptidase
MKDGLIDEIQLELRSLGLDGWFFTSFRGSDPIAESFLRGNIESLTTRRYFYFIPSIGEPTKILHRIEPHSLKDVPGKDVFYSKWQEWQGVLSDTLKNRKKIAAQYSPSGIIPALSRLDLGVGEFIRSLGIEIASSGDLVAKFTVTLNKEMVESHLRALKILEESIFLGFKTVKDAVYNSHKIDEFSLQQKLLNFLYSNNLTTNAPPIVAINENAADPHFEPTKESSKIIRKGDVLLIDIWAKEKDENSIYADITWCGIVDKIGSAEMDNIFEIVLKGRDAGFEKAKECKKREVCGWEVDRATRDFIEKAGFGEFFTHRTGHSIFTEDHADGANMDDFETRDFRKLIPNTLFSIEPGIYIKGRVGFRSEIDVLVTKDGAQVTGRKQEKLIRILE